MHFATIRGSDMQNAAKVAFQESMRKRLAKKPWIADHSRFIRAFFEMCNGLTPGSAVIPDFAVACRRLTPGPGYLEALCQDNVRSVYEVRDNALTLIDVDRSSLSLRTLSGSPSLALNSSMAHTTIWMLLYVQLVSKCLRNNHLLSSHNRMLTVPLRIRYIVPVPLPRHRAWRKDTQ